MNTTTLILWIVSGVVPLVGIFLGLVFLALYLAKSMGGTTGGWQRLLEVYASDGAPPGETVKRQSIQIGAVTYKNCVTLGVTDQGLYVSLRQKTVRIPWGEIRAVGQATLFWQKVPMLTVGDPPVATMTVPVAVFQTMRTKLPAGLIEA